MEATFICLNYRSPIGSLGGVLSSFDPVFLSSMLLKNFSKIDEIFDMEDVDHYILGNAIDSNFGPNLINRIVKKSVLPKGIKRTQISQGSITGLKLLDTAIQALHGEAHVVLCQSVENMSSIPDYIPNRRLRNGQELKDSIVISGILRDAYYLEDHKKIASGISEQIALKYGIDRKEMDQWAIRSNEKYDQALTEGYYKGEISPIGFPGNEGQVRVLREDQEHRKRLSPTDILNLSTTFEKEGKLTDATIAGSGDGSAIMIIADEKGMRKTGLIPVARIMSYNENFYSEDYIECGKQSIEKALAKANLSLEDIDLFEIHEDTAITPIGIQKALQIDEAKINQKGGSLAIANPISVTGVRLLTTICNQFRNNYKLRYGLVHISDPSGMSCTVVLENA
jgi:acetyl-CoA C-acetyltransferase